MSYCVNCGVKLEDSIKSCPLCNTPVLNPMHEIDQKPTRPFPSKSGQVEHVKRKDLGILVSVVLIATGFSCGLLNLLVFTASSWSLLIIGACILLWVLLIPAVIYTKMPVYIYLIFDGFAILLYLFLISIVTPTDQWFFELAIPITAICTILSIFFAILYHNISTSFLATALYFFLEIPILCILIECLVRKFLQIPILLTWSAVVLTACTIVNITLITVLSKSRLRNAVRRRLHF
ncbi:MAG: DUF6320 domain-containing protein [Lachnospiraceae bacterium]